MFMDEEADRASLSVVSRDLFPSSGCTLVIRRAITAGLYKTEIETTIRYDDDDDDDDLSRRSDWIHTHPHTHTYTHPVHRAECINLVR